MENNMKLSIYRNGTRLMLVLDNYTEDNEKILNRILQGVLGQSPTVQDVDGLEAPSATGDTVPDPADWERVPQQQQNAPAATQNESTEQVEQEPDTPPAEKPVEQPEDGFFPDVFLANGQYAGVTPQEAFEQDGIAAVVYLCTHSSEIEQEDVREQVVAGCKKAILADIKARAKAPEDTDDIKTFIRTYSPLAGGVIKKQLQGIDFSEYWQNTTKEAKQELYGQVITNLFSRVSA